MAYKSDPHLDCVIVLDLGVLVSEQPPGEGHLLAIKLTDSGTDVRLSVPMILGGIQHTLSGLDSCG